MDTIVELQDTPVMRIRADMKGKGPSAAFEQLESRLPTLKGRRFYGAFRKLADGEEEYYACVEQIESDDPVKMRLETGTIPGGKYASRKIVGWEKIVQEGMLPRVFEGFVKSHEPNVDHQEIRPSLEFYRSHDELFLFMPLKDVSPSVASP